MEEKEQEKGGKGNAPGQNKEFTILVNSREKTWSEKEVNYDEVIILAFGQVSQDPNVSYTVAYKKGENEKAEGIMVKGDSIKVKDGMRFNVTQTNRS